jgi:hypothetical protein
MGSELIQLGFELAKMWFEDGISKMQFGCILRAEMINAFQKSRQMYDM